MKQSQASNIDEYISQFPKEKQQLLVKVRETIRDAAPQAEEAIKYAIPTFVLNGNLVHFAAFEHHIGFYPTPDGIKAFKKDLTPYKQSKGTIQFPIDKPLPLALIRKIVNYRVKETLKHAKATKK